MGRPSFTYNGRWIEWDGNSAISDPGARAVSNPSSAEAEAMYRQTLSTGELLEQADPATRQYYEYAKPYFKAVIDEMVATGDAGHFNIKSQIMPVKTVNGVTVYGKPPEGTPLDPARLEWAYLYDQAQPNAKRLTPEEWVSAFYKPKQSWWDKKGAPALSIGLQFASLIPGLNPAGALAKGLGSTLGSKVAGQALSSAALSAATGGDPLQGLIAGGLGAASGKLASGTVKAAGLAGKTGDMASAFVRSIAEGADPAAAFAGAVAGAIAPGMQKEGGNDMKLKDLLGAATAGALINQGSPGTGAGAAVALSLLGNNGLVSGGGKLGDTLNTALGTWLAGRLYGQNGAQSAAAGAVQGIYNNYLTTGKLDDALKELGKNLPGDSYSNTKQYRPTGQQDWQQILMDFLSTYIGGQQGSQYGDYQQQVAQSPQATDYSSLIGMLSGAVGPSQAEVPDIVPLYNDYYQQLASQYGTQDYEAAQKQQYEATRAQLEKDYLENVRRLDAEMNRRGLFSSGLAQNQQNLLRGQYMDSLANASAQTALSTAEIQRNTDAQRQAMAWELASQRQQQLIQVLQTEKQRQFLGGALQQFYGQDPLVSGWNPYSTAVATQTPSNQSSNWTQWLKHLSPVLYGKNSAGSQPASMPQIQAAQPTGGVAAGLAASFGNALSGSQYPAVSAGSAVGGASGRVSSIVDSIRSAKDLWAQGNKTGRSALRSTTRKTSTGLLGNTAGYTLV